MNNNSSTSTNSTSSNSNNNNNAIVADDDASLSASAASLAQQVPKFVLSTYSFNFELSFSLSLSLLLGVGFVENVACRYVLFSCNESLDYVFLRYRKQLRYDQINCDKRNKSPKLKCVIFHFSILFYKTTFINKIKI